MSRDKRRPWFRMNPGDFYSAPTVVVLTKDERRAYREALDLTWMTATPGIATPDQWRVMMGYSLQEWGELEVTFAPLFVCSGESWVQKRVLSEFEHATAKSQSATESVRKRYERSADVPQMLDVRCKIESEPNPPATSPLRSEVAPPASVQAPTSGKNVALIRGLAEALAMPKAQKHKPAWTAPVWEWIKVHVPADKQSAMMAFAGWLHKTGTADPDEMLSLVKHAHVYDPRNPMAYFANTGTTRANIAMTVQLDKRIIEHEELKRADRELFGVANRRA
jgi:uncharacterized protein YdaU (DUF1376 family)